MGFEAKETIRYHCNVWILHFSKLEFLEKCHKSYIKHHSLKSIKIIDENVYFLKAIYWLCTLSEAHKAITSKDSWTTIMKVHMLYLERQPRKHKTKNEGKQHREWNQSFPPSHTSWVGVSVSVHAHFCLHTESLWEAHEVSYHAPKSLALTSLVCITGYFNLDWFLSL